jgi:hypothetical protein
MDRYTTIADYLANIKSDNIQMDNYFFPGMLANDSVKSKVLDDSILNPYDGILDKYRKEYTFTNEEYRIYKYNPWRLAQDVYGSHQYWFLVLHANELYSASEFDLKTVSMYTTDVLDVLSEITIIQDKQLLYETAKNNKKMDEINAELQSKINEIYNTQIVSSYSY